MAPLGDSLALLFSELVEGPKDDCYMLNKGDGGLLKSLDALSAAAASKIPRAGGATIASHVDHVLYGLSLFNRWAAGEEDAWDDADWTASWEHSSVSDEEWQALRDQFRIEARKWNESLAHARDLEGIELNGAIASIAHLAYHMGAIRQIDRSLRGPSAEDVA